jgi:diguanylate cyclase (GGDEF)-like protein
MTYIQKRKLKYYGLILVIIAAITFTTLAFLKYYNATNKAYLQELETLHQIEKSAIDLQYFFKRQVQEWKNILLRGSTPEDFELYTTLFSEEFMNTQVAADRLYNRIDASSEAKPLALDFITIHKAILADYLDAIEIFKDSNFDAAMADKSVRGIDRAPTFTLDQVSQIVTIEVGTKKDRLKQSLHELTVVSGTVFALIQLTLLWLILRLTDKLLQANVRDKETELGNREFFVHSIDDALKGNKASVVIILDINNFKLINEAFGNNGGDTYLKNVAQKLQQCTSKGDVLCRIGGDTLGVIAYTHDDTDVDKIVRRLLDVIAEHEHSNQSVSIALSACAGAVGITQTEDTNREQVLNKVFACLQEAKSLGPDNHVVFDQSDRRISSRQQQMRAVTEINLALKECRLALFKQQIKPFNEDAHHTYHEVLLRVIDEQGNIQSPGLFLQAAERFHLMDKVDRYVLSSLVDYLLEHPEDNTHYTVNLSGNTLSDINFIDFVDTLFASSDINHALIGFEITETNIIKNFDIASSVLNKLSSYRCKISLDDFGTGMSSYGYISRLHIDTLKIDGTFIQDIDTREDNQAILRSIVGLAHDLGISTVAEFIETQSELDTVKKLNVDYVQGYLLHKPSMMYHPKNND